MNSDSKLRSGALPRDNEASSNRSSKSEEPRIATMIQYISDVTDLDLFSNASGGAGYMGTVRFLVKLKTMRAGPNADSPVERDPRSDPIAVPNTWSQALLTGQDASNPRMSAFASTVDEPTKYFRCLTATRPHAAPANDLISELFQKRDSQGDLSEEEVLATLILMLVTGHETTVNMLANGLWALLRHENAYARLVADSAGIPCAIEKILRFESPVKRTTFRVVTEPLRLGDVTIGQGHESQCCHRCREPRPRLFRRATPI